MEPSYRIFYADGTESGRIEGEPTLEEAQEAVGGYVERAQKNDQYAVLVNEDGYMKKLPVNPKFPMYVGNVVFVFNSPEWLA